MAKPSENVNISRDSGYEWAAVTVRGIAVGLFVLLASVPAEAATYYVSRSGSDGNACAAAQNASTPKQTIASGITCLNAGDTLYIRTGTYAESLVLFGWPGGTQGTSWSNPITISAYPGESVTIRPNAGAEFVLVMRGSGSGATDAPKYLIFNNLIFDGTNVSIHGVGIVAWDNTVNPANAPSHHIRFTGSRITNVPQGQGIYAGWGSDGVELINCEIDHINGPSPVPNNTQGTYLAANDILIDGCYIHDNWGFGSSNANALFTTSNHIIRNSRFERNGLGGTGLGGINEGDGVGHRIYNNVVVNNGGPGIVLRYDSGTSGIQVLNNSVFGNAGSGIEIGPNERSAVVQNNISYSNRGGDFLNNGGGTTVSNNLFGVNPLFVNTNSGDFHLQAASAAINAGVTIATVTTDMSGVRRPQGAAYDLGAYEFGAPQTSGPPAPPTGVHIVSWW